MSDKPKMVIIASFTDGGGLDCHVECPHDDDGCKRNAEAIAAVMALLGVGSGDAELVEDPPKIPEASRADEREKAKQ